MISKEVSEKVRRSFSPDKTDSQYLMGDLVQLNEMGDNKWCGPASVIGQDNHLVLVKHHGEFYRIHPSRLQLLEEICQPRGEREQQNKCTSVNIETIKKEEEIVVLSDDTHVHQDARKDGEDEGRPEHTESFSLMDVYGDILFTNMFCDQLKLQAIAPTVRHQGDTWDTGGTGSHIII